MRIHEDRIRRGLGATGLAAFLAFAAGAAILSVSFLERQQFSWAEMNMRVVAMVGFVAAAYFCHACVRFSFLDAWWLLITSCVVSLIAEAAGLRSALPFGARYHYHPDLHPIVPGGVPLVIPLMWFVLVYTPMVFVGWPEARPRRTPGTRATSDARCKKRSGRCPGRIALCALYVTATDLFIDPLGTATGMWTWSVPGRYFDTPLTNYGGWFAVAIAIYAAFAWIRGSRPSVSVRPGSSPVVDRSFTCVSTLLTLLCVVACVARRRDGLPALLSVAVMAPYWVLGFMPRTTPSGK